MESCATVVDVVRRFREKRDLSELELRLGVSEGTRFRAGVTRETFDQLHTEMGEELEADRHWCELVDYHYTTARGEKVRTRVEFDANCMELHRTHTVKQPQRCVLLQQGDDVDTCRVAWSLETPLQEPPPTACVPTHVRVKQRKAFRDRRDGKVVWSYELSKTWAAGSRSAVEHLQHVGEPVYEVECELVDEDGVYLDAHDDEHVARSLVLKATALLGAYDPSDLRATDQSSLSTSGGGKKRK